MSIPFSQGGGEELRTPLDAAWLRTLDDQQVAENDRLVEPVTLFFNYSRMQTMLLTGNKQMHTWGLDPNTPDAP